MKKLGIFVGSLREGSYSKKTAKVIAKQLENDFEVSFINIRNLKFYDEDLEQEGKVPAEWTKFRDEVKEMDAFLFVTPEYNRSVPAVLKNALDVGSRPYGSSVWDGKPGAIVSTSTGAIGGFGANHHLRQSMTFLNVYMMQQPEIYLGDSGACFNDEGQVVERTEKYLNKFSQAFKTWVNKFN